MTRAAARAAQDEPAWEAARDVGRSRLYVGKVAQCSESMNKAQWAWGYMELVSGETSSTVCMYICV